MAEGGRPSRPRRRTAVDGPPAGQVRPSHQKSHSAPASGSAVGEVGDSQTVRPAAQGHRPSPMPCRHRQGPGQDVVARPVQQRFASVRVLRDPGGASSIRGPRPRASRASGACQTARSRRTGPGFKPAAGRMADMGLGSAGASAGGRGQAGRPVTGRSPRVGERRPFRTIGRPPASASASAPRRIRSRRAASGPGSASLRPRPPASPRSIAGRLRARAEAGVSPAAPSPPPGPSNSPLPQAGSRGGAQAPVRRRSRLPGAVGLAHSGRTRQPLASHRQAQAVRLEPPGWRS